MRITDVCIVLAIKQPVYSRLKAYASVTFDDCFVVKELRIIQGDSGLFVAMPDRPVKDHCPNCNGRNSMISVYCCFCGFQLPRTKEPPKNSVYADIAHPITAEFRREINQHVLDQYDIVVTASTSDIPLPFPEE